MADTKTEVKEAEALPSSAQPSPFANLSLEHLRKFLEIQRVEFTEDDDVAALVRLAEAVGPQRDLGSIRGLLRRRMREPGHDEGSLGPLFIRFAWHCSGTYDKNKGTGGSDGATMRFPVEQSDPENAGLGKARKVLDEFRDQECPWMSYADIYILAGYVAIEASGGPNIPYCTGRRDFTLEEARAVFGASGCPFGDGAFNPHKSRLPAADLGPDTSLPASAPVHEREKKTIDAIRGTFTRMGFDDKETVCLIVLGHQFGRCHSDVSGYENAWYAFDPTHWNVYSSGLGYLSLYSFSNNLQEVRTAKGKRQWQLRLGGATLMLPADLALKWDADYYTRIKHYDRNRLEFRADAALVWKKLTELGCKHLVPEIRAF